MKYMMNVKLYTVISFIAYFFSVVLFDYYAVKFYASETEVASIDRILMLMSHPFSGAFLLSFLIWIFKRNLYWTKFIWSLIFLNSVLLVVNLLATYLMYWSVNK